MTKLRVLDLFSGIGGFSLGLERTGGFETVAFCEIEPFPRRVLAKHWPDVPCYDDVRTLTAERLDADGISVDVICGGFPCQDVSVAGLRAGIEGERSGLWSEIVRLARDIRPRFILVENVAGLLGNGFSRVLGDLAEIGFDAEWHCIPASAVGAPHSRDRVWILAYSKQIERFCSVFDTDYAAQEIRTNQTVRRENGIRSQMGTARRSLPGRWMDRPAPVGMVDGVSDWPHQLAALGNAVVPQIPEMIGRAILETINV